MDLDFAEVLLEVIDRRASDLHITAGAPPMVRRLHDAHSVRASRWATTQSMAEATRKGSMPISISRVMAEGVSLVCSVESTM